MTITNPYKPGSQAHQHFATYVTWYATKPLPELKTEENYLREESQDFMRHGWKAMYNLKFQADCIATIAAARQA